MISLSTADSTAARSPASECAGWNRRREFHPRSEDGFAVSPSLEGRSSVDKRNHRCLSAFRQIRCAHRIRAPGPAPTPLSGRCPRRRSGRVIALPSGISPQPTSLPDQIPRTRTQADRGNRNRDAGGGSQNSVSKDLASLNEISRRAALLREVRRSVAWALHGLQPPDGRRITQLFGHLPKSKLVVIPMEAARSKKCGPPTTRTEPPTVQRPGRIKCQRVGSEHRLLLNVEAIAYHEGVPGHHLQLSLAQEMPDLPAFRRHAGYTAFVEGWALYAERLGQEVGRYQDRVQRLRTPRKTKCGVQFASSSTPAFTRNAGRAAKMVDYFHRYTAMDEPNVQSEVDRYIAWPGQALAYKLGQLEFWFTRTSTPET